MTVPAAPLGASIPGARAAFRGVRAAHAVESVDVLEAPHRVAAGGWWAVVGEFSGRVRAWRFAEVEHTDDDAVPDPRVQAAAAPQAGERVRGQAHTVDEPGAAPWVGPPREAWRSSMSRPQYESAVAATREAIRQGAVFQANICRVLSAPLPRDAAGREPDASALAALLRVANPAPFGGFVHVPTGVGMPGTWVVSASPELFLRRRGDVLTSSPIKGTASEPAGLAAKDRAENVMITDLVRNDLQRVCAPGSVEVAALLALEHHPGLVHLVSTVTGRLRPEVAGAHDAWAQILRATYPPGSVAGAPKSSALRTIDRLEPVARGPYCGVVGWIDADAGTAELAVAIRTFWWDDDAGGTLRFGTGAGITWGSDPAGEWAETELKARHLVTIASGRPDWSAWTSRSGTTGSSSNPTSPSSRGSTTA